jgi:hypothetical protein
MWNLLKVLNKDMYLKNLNNINEVYDYQANLVEEITYFHELKGNNAAAGLESSCSSELGSPNMSIESNPSGLVKPINNVNFRDEKEDDSYLVEDEDIDVDDD